MKSCQNALKTTKKPSSQPINFILDATAFYQTQFTDKKICTETQTNLTPSKNNNSGVQLGPKQKLSQIVYNLKSSDFFAKYEQEKKESLRKEWMNMKKQHIRLAENDHETQNKKKAVQVFMKSINSKGKFNQFDAQCQQVAQKNQNEPILQKNQQKREQKRKRSKTQMLIYDYELEKVGSLDFSNHLQQDCQNSHNITTNKLKDNPKQKIQNIDNKNKAVSDKSGDWKFIKSESKSKSYLEQVRDATHIKFTSYQQQLEKRKSSLQSQPPILKNDQVQRHCLSRPRNPISKSVMVQKIINLRKTFNDKYKKSPKKSLIESSIIQSSFGQSKQAPPPTSDQNTNLIIPYLSFPVMNLKVTRKLTFHELFQHEKKKMELLKKYVKKGGVFNSFVQDSMHIREDANQLNESLPSNLMNLSQFSNSKSFLMEDSSSYLNYLNWSKNIKKPKAKWSQLQQEQIKTIKSKSKMSPQDLLNISSIQIIDPNNSLQKDLVEPSSQKKQPEPPQCRVTTYDFDYMNRHLQRPEVKELRHKYLYSSKRKFSKQQCSQFGIAMASIHNRDQTTLRKWKIKCKTESVMEECLEIEKKIPQNWDRMGKTSSNFIKTTYDRKKAASLDKQAHLPSKEIHKNTHSFEPWQNQAPHEFGETDLGEFPD